MRANIAIVGSTGNAGRKKIEVLVMKTLASRGVIAGRFRSVFIPDEVLFAKPLPTLLIY
jgi:hypothetical protein